MASEISYPTLTLLEKPVVEPLTLADIKIYLRIDGSSENSILTTFLSAAREAAEAYMKNSIIKQKWKLIFYGSMPNKIQLPRGPVSEIVSVKLFDEEENSTTISATEYYLNGKYSMCLNASYSSHRIEVEYYSGFSEDSADVPEIIKQGLLCQIAYMYENRGTGVGALDDAARSLFNFYKNIYL